MQCLGDLGHLIGLKRRSILFAFCATTSLSFGGVTAALADASIVVDASTTLAQSDSGNDLATLQNIFQDANAPAEPLIEPALTPVNQIIADLKMKRVRLLQNDIYCDVDGSGNFGYTSNGTFTPGNCYPLAWELQWALGNHLSPHVPVASYMPPSFTGYGPAETWPQAQLDRFKTYAHQLVRYIVSKSVTAGAPSVVFEISNEIDIADYEPVNWNSSDMSQATLLPLGPWGRWLWWINPKSYQITQWPPAGANSYPYPTTGLAYPYGSDVRRLDHGISPVHQIFAKAVDNVSAEFSGKINLIMAGPATAGLSFFWNPSHGLPTLEEDFLDQILKPYSTNCGSSNPTCNGQFNSRLDRYSFHFYGSAEPTVTLETITGTIRNKLQSLGRSDVKLFVSEWGPSTIETTDVNYSHKGAAWGRRSCRERSPQRSRWDPISSWRMA